MIQRGLSPMPVGPARTDASDVQLLDPAALEARLAEARAQRAEAIARRTAGNPPQHPYEWQLPRVRAQAGRPAESTSVAWAKSEAAVPAGSPAASLAEAPGSGLPASRRVSEPAPRLPAESGSARPQSQSSPLRRGLYWAGMALAFGFAVGLFGASVWLVTTAPARLSHERSQAASRSPSATSVGETPPAAPSTVPSTPAPVRTRAALNPAALDAPRSSATTAARPALPPSAAVPMDVALSGLRPLGRVAPTPPEEPASLEAIRGQVAALAPVSPLYALPAVRLEAPTAMLAPAMTIPIEANLPTSLRLPIPAAPAEPWADAALALPASPSATGEAIDRVRQPVPEVRLPAERNDFGRAKMRRYQQTQLARPRQCRRRRRRWHRQRCGSPWLPPKAVAA